MVSFLKLLFPCVFYCGVDDKLTPHTLFAHYLSSSTDSPALSAAQVGIAVEGATQAAQNAADLILTEPGLSPIVSYTGVRNEMLVVAGLFTQTISFIFFSCHSVWSCFGIA